MSDSLIDSGDPPPMSSSMDEFDPFTVSTNKANGTSTDKSPTTGNPLYDLLHGEGESNGDDIVDLTSPTIDSLKQSSTSTNSDLLAEINSELQFDQSECLEQNGSVAMTTSYLSENGEEETMTTTTTTETRMTESYEEEDGMVVTKTETISESHEVPVKKSSQEVEVLQEEDEEEEEEEKAYMERVETKEAEQKEEEEEEFVKYEGEVVKYEEEVVKYEEDIEAEAYLEEEEEGEKKEEEKEEIQVQGTAEIETIAKQKDESEEEEDEDDGTANESEVVSTMPSAEPENISSTEFFPPPPAEVLVSSVAESGGADTTSAAVDFPAPPPEEYSRPVYDSPRFSATYEARSMSNTNVSTPPDDDEEDESVVAQCSVSDSEGNANDDLVQRSNACLGTSPEPSHNAPAAEGGSERQDVDTVTVDEAEPSDILVDSECRNDKDADDVDQEVVAAIAQELDAVLDEEIDASVMPEPTLDKAALDRYANLEDETTTSTPSGMQESIEEGSQALLTNSGRGSPPPEEPAPSPPPPPQSTAPAAPEADEVTLPDLALSPPDLDFLVSSQATAQASMESSLTMTISSSSQPELDSPDVEDPREIIEDKETLASEGPSALQPPLNYDSADVGKSCGVLDESPCEINAKDEVEDDSLDERHVPEARILSPEDEEPPSSPMDQEPHEDVVEPSSPIEDVHAELAETEPIKDEPIPAFEDDDDEPEREEPSPDMVESMIVHKFDEGETSNPEDDQVDLARSEDACSPEVPGVNTMSVKCEESVSVSPSNESPVENEQSVSGLENAPKPLSESVSEDVDDKEDEKESEEEEESEEDEEEEEEAVLFTPPPGTHNEICMLLTTVQEESDEDEEPFQRPPTPEPFSEFPAPPLEPMTPSPSGPPPPLPDTLPPGECPRELSSPVESPEPADVSLEDATIEVDALPESDRPSLVVKDVSPCASPSESPVDLAAAPEEDRNSAPEAEDDQPSGRVSVEEDTPPVPESPIPEISSAEIEPTKEKDEVVKIEESKAANEVVLSSESPSLSNKVPVKAANELDKSEDTRTVSSKAVKPDTLPSIAVKPQSSVKDIVSPGGASFSNTTSSSGGTPDEIADTYFTTSENLSSMTSPPSECDAPIALPEDSSSKIDSQSLSSLSSPAADQSDLNITSPPAQTKKSMVTEYYQPANSGKVDKPAQRFEDTISDYQPPKRYTKPEEKEPKAASTVFNASSTTTTTTTTTDDHNNNVSSITDGSDQPKSQYETEAEPQQSVSHLVSLWKTGFDQTENAHRFRGGGSSEGRTSSSRSPVVLHGGNDNRCKVCEKRVYQMEQIIVEKNMYHKSCFKCEKCKRVLSLGSYSGIEGRVFCKPHFIEMFKQKVRATICKASASQAAKTWEGNYEEGFGMERHKNKWVKKEDMPAVKSPEIERMEANLEDGNAPEITRAEDVVDDGIGEIKSLRNARSLFEAKNEEPTTPQKLERRPGTKLVKTWVPSAQSNGHDEDEDIEKDPNIAREERKRDEFQFSSLSSTREALEQKARDEAEPRVRSPGEGQGQDLPAVNTKQLLSRFTSQQEEDNERKPVRKITPPHGEPLIVTNIPDDVEIERDPNIVRSDEAVQREEEIPKAEKTRGLLAKFKALEKADAEPPSPSRAPPSKIKIDRRGIDESSEVKVNGESGVFENQPEQFQQYQPSAESGIYENVPEHNEDVVREQEERDREEEKPKAGVTRSLLSRWKTMESEVESAPPPMPGRGRQFTPPRDDSRRVRTPSPVPSGFAVKNEYVDPKDEIAKSKGSVSENVPAAKPDVVRETDINQDEKAVPEKQFTKSALGKFQKIQEDAGKEKFTSQRKGLRKVSPQKKQPVASQQIDGDENGDDMLDDVYEANADIVRSDDPAPDELPPPSFAKNLLAKFRSMEDRNRPPPSPARSASMRNLTRPKKFTVRHRSNSEENIEIPREERPKPEGGEIEAVNGDRYNYENSPGSGVSENTPDVKPDLVRESDTHTEEELPERGTAKNLLAKFQAMGQAQ